MALESILEETEAHMRQSVEATAHECGKIRTGRANAAILDGVDVDCYGGRSPINQIAGVSAPEPRTIVIQPFDPSILRAIETAIMKSDIGLTPNNDGKIIRLNLPPLTEERRKDLVKVVRRLGEEGKVALRNHRHKANDSIKKGEKDGEIPRDDAKRFLDEVQTLTEKYSSGIDSILKDKEEEILNF